MTSKQIVLRLIWQRVQSWNAHAGWRTVDDWRMQCGDVTEDDEEKIKACVWDFFRLNNKVSQSHTQDLSLKTIKQQIIKSGDFVSWIFPCDHVSVFPW